MSYKYIHKKKCVHLEDSLHKELSNRAKKKKISMERILNEILKNEFKE